MADATAQAAEATGVDRQEAPEGKSMTWTQQNCNHEQIDAHQRHVPGRTGQCRDCGAEMVYVDVARAWWTESEYYQALDDVELSYSEPAPTIGLVDHDKYESRRSRR